MARPLRLEIPVAVYHLTARGNARQDIFLDDQDRAGFLALLGREIIQQQAGSWPGIKSRTDPIDGSGHAPAPGRI